MGFLTIEYDIVWSLECFVTYAEYEHGLKLTLKSSCLSDFVINTDSLRLYI
jgi:hypothetical protein